MRTTPTWMERVAPSNNNLHAEKVRRNCIELVWIYDLEHRLGCLQTQENVLKNGYKQRRRHWLKVRLIRTAILPQEKYRYYHAEINNLIWALRRAANKSSPSRGRYVAHPRRIIHIFLSNIMYIPSMKIYPRLWPSSVANPFRYLKEKSTYACTCPTASHNNHPTLQQIYGQPVAV